MSYTKVSVFLPYGRHSRRVHPSCSGKVLLKAGSLLKRRYREFVRGMIKEKEGNEG